MKKNKKWKSILAFFLKKNIIILTVVNKIFSGQWPHNESFLAFDLKGVPICTKTYYKYGGNVTES